MRVFSTKGLRSPAEYREIAISILTIASILCAVLLFLFPLAAGHRVAIYVFDLIVVGVLAADFSKRLVSSSNRSRFLAQHWVELPALIPLAFLAFINSLFPSIDLKFLYFITFFRLIRLYDALKYFRGNEFIYMSAFVIITLIFGSISAYFVERNAPGATITSFGLALWWAVTTMTTVDYGDVVPVTVPGKIIAVVIMITGIGVLWTFVAAVASSIVSRRVRKDMKDDLASSVPSEQESPINPFQYTPNSEKKDPTDARVNSPTAPGTFPGPRGSDGQISQDVVLSLIAILKKLDKEDYDALVEIMKTIRDEHGAIDKKSTAA